MATKKPSPAGATGDAGGATNPTEALLLAALERGDGTLETGRYLVTYRESAMKEGLRSLKTRGFNVADARDFKDQAVSPDEVSGADALVFPEIGVAVVGGESLRTRGLSVQDEPAGDDPVETIEPEYFVFAENRDYLRGFARAAGVIARDLGAEREGVPPADEEEEDPGAEFLGATWGLIRCKVPPSGRSGAGIRVAVLDTGMDVGHPDFAGRPLVTQSFVGQPVQDLNGHGTHCIGTACGPRAPAGTTPRYGVAYASRIYVGKVLTNSGSGTGAGVLAGMNWAIANNCHVISMSLGSQSPVQAAYTNAGRAALARGLLIVAAAGNAAASTGAPANSPTILSVASLDPTLAPSSFSNRGKIELAAPGRDIFSAWPRPTRYRTISGTSMACPHVAGCAALWAQSSASLRGLALWNRLRATARKLPYAATRVGAGLVQAP
ncbi:MAG TPA: S8 family serine peptidase [Verrucomicrobiota bacterium]|nr:S8 family serine peptidase [Verrucomicrobiota bacterium]